MKNKKGFTLIELLAVIVIVAIIALVAVPQILNVIYKAKLGAAKSSANGIINSAKKYVSEKLLSEPNATFDDIIEFQCNNINCSYNEDILHYSGSKAISGKIIIANNGANIELENLVINGFTCNKALEEQEVYCEQGTGEIVDKNKGVICGDKNEEDYDNVNECYIKSIEDYKEFYTLVNSGKNFKDKTVYLMKNLDFKGINDIEPIGNKTNQFSGTFKGNAYTLANINIKGNSYVGIFGYIFRGSVEGLNVKDINIEATGNYVGGIAGYSFYGTIKQISLIGSIQSTRNYVGGIVGYTASNQYPYDKVTGVLVNANVTGNTYVGGVVGASEYFSGYKPSISGIVGSGTITATATEGRAGKITSSASNSYYGTSFASSIVKVSAKSVGGNGYEYQPNAQRISMFDGILDTYIGGDNDSDGGYFDYDSNGKLAFFRLDEKPISFTLKGEGTEENPYIINNVKEWKQATTRLNKCYKLNSDLHFGVNQFYSLGTINNPFTGSLEGNNHEISNLLIEGHNYSGLSGYNSGLIRNLSLNNITIKGNSYVGMVGYSNGGKLELLNIDNIKVQATGDYVGGIIGGGNSGTVNEIVLSGNIESTGNYVGGAVGTSVNLNSVLLNVNVTGNNYVGGISGSGGGRAVIDSGTITAKNGKGGKVSGSSDSAYGLFSSDVVLSSSSIANGGYEYESSDIHRISMLDNALDTYIGGDNDSSGYYFDYNEDGKVELFSIKENPINFTLKGEGTEENPYIINNEAEWKQATARLNKYYKLNSDLKFDNKRFYSLGTYNNPFTGNLDGNNHKISNLELKGIDYIGLSGYNSGTISNLELNNFNIKGNNYTGVIGYNYGIINNLKLKNFSVEANDYTGVIGYNYGTVTNLDLENFNVNARNYIGVVGYNFGIFQNLKFDNGNVVGNDNVGLIGLNDFWRTKGGFIDNGIFSNITIKSTGNYAGGIVGYNSSTVRNIIFYGDVLSSGDYVGGAFGYTDSSSSKNIMISGQIIGNNYVGGLIGKSYYSSVDVESIVESSNIVATSIDGYAGRIMANQNCKGKGMISGMVNVTATNIVNVNCEVDMNSQRISAFDNMFDTYIGGDNDSNGYYLDYDTSGKIVLVNAEEKPIIFNLQGEGTEENPYIINNVEDWKQATTRLNKHYKLNSDLKFGINQFYSLGTYNNPFIGSLDGNNHKISNLSIEGYDYTGFSGYNSGTIKNLEFDSINVKGYDRIGIIGYSNGELENLKFNTVNISGNDRVGLIGLDDGPINNLNAYNINIVGNNRIGIIGSSAGAVSNLTFDTINVTGNTYTGIIGYSNGIISNGNFSNIIIKGISEIGLVGYMYNTNGGRIEGINIENIDIEATGNNVGGIVGYFRNGIIKEVTITGNILSTGNNIGGIVGYSYNCSGIKNILANTNVTGNNYVGGILGNRNYGLSISAIIEDGQIAVTSENGSAGKVSSKSYGGNVFVSSSVVLLAPTIGSNGTEYDATYTENLSYYETLKNGNDYIIETLNTGDYNKSGYVFGYRNVNGVNKIQVIKVG